MRITVEDYLMGREKLYDCPPEIREHAAVTVGKVNALLAVLEEEGVPLEAHPKTQTIISSGWRPAQINRGVKGAAPKSKHITADACDLYDPEGDIDEYLSSHPDVLLALGIYMEHPSATKGWSHVQTIGPRSGRRIFYP